MMRGWNRRSRRSGPPAGAATPYAPTPSSSGRAARAASMIASTSCGCQTAPGAPNASRLDMSEADPAFDRIREIVHAVAPDADEGTRYGMPAFIYAGRPLLGFRAAKRHLSLFPFSPAAIESVKDRLEGFDLAKGTIRFTPDHPVPEDVLADLVRARRREITGGS